MRAMIWKGLVTGLILLGAFLLQNNFFAAIPLIQTTPNLLLLVTVTLGLLHGKLTGLAVGFFCRAVDRYFRRNAVRTVRADSQCSGVWQRLFYAVFFSGVCDAAHGSLCGLRDFVWTVYLHFRFSVSREAGYRLLFSGGHSAGDGLYRGDSGDRVSFSDVCEPPAGYGGRKKECR